MRKFIVKILSTFFYAGYFPLVPGTFASLIGLFLFFLVKDNFYSYIGLIFLVILIGFSVAGEAEKIFRQKDSPRIVIDEIAGMLLSFMFLPYDIKILISAFLLFRILDALKPYPVDKIQKLKGSLAVMGDDILAGLYTNIVLQVVLRLASFKAS